MYEINKNSLNSFNERQIDWSIDSTFPLACCQILKTIKRCLEIKSNPNNLKLAYIKLKLLRAATVRRLPEPLRANKKLFLFFLFLARVSREPLYRRCCWQRKLEVARHFISTSFFGPTVLKKKHTCINAWWIHQKTKLYCKQWLRRIDLAVTSWMLYIEWRLLKSKSQVENYFSIVFTIH